MARVKSKYQKSRDSDYRKSLSEDFEKFGGVILKKRIKKNKEEVAGHKPMLDYKAILRDRSTITKRDWGGHSFEYCDKEIAHSGKVDDLTQEEAAVICGILKIPLTEEAADRMPKGSMCPCGCGEMLKKGATFRQGHDTRLRCRLIKGYEKTKSKVILKELRKWNWEKYLG